MATPFRSSEDAWDAMTLPTLGDPWHRPTKHLRKTSVYLTRDEAAALRWISRRERRSQADLLRQAIRWIIHCSQQNHRVRKPAPHEVDEKIVRLGDIGRDPREQVLSRTIPERAEEIVAADRQRNE